MIQGTKQRRGRHVAERTYLLKFLYGNRDGQSMEIPHGADLSIGRSKRCDMRIMSASVSRIHCRITQQDGALRVEDLNSLTGTYVNDQRVVGSMILGEGDALRVGPVTFQVVRSDLPTTQEWYSFRPLYNGALSVDVQLGASQTRARHLVSGCGLPEAPSRFEMEWCCK